MSGETYKLTCHACRNEIEVPAGDPEARVVIGCPRCAADLDYWWRAAEAVGLSPDREQGADHE